jgi:hypothetical protein
MRGSFRVVLPFVVPVAIGCGGDDLTLPGSGEPATLSIVSGDGQNARVGEALSLPLVVKLADARGQPVSGATVNFRFSEDLPDAAVDPTTRATDSLGQASATVRLGTTPGNQPIDAQVAMPGQDLQVRFRLTALAKDPPGDGQGGGGDSGSSAGPPSSGGGDPPGDGGGGGGNGSGRSWLGWWRQRQSWRTQSPLK